MIYFISRLNIISNGNRDILVPACFAFDDVRILYVYGMLCIFHFRHTTRQGKG